MSKPTTVVSVRGRKAADLPGDPEIAFHAVHLAKLADSGAAS